MEQDLEERSIHQKLFKMAEAHKLDIRAGKVRRSSSRFCFGIEHGDYNNLEVFGVGTNRYIWIAYKPNACGYLRLLSGNFPEEGVIDISLKESPSITSIQDSWSRFPFGVSEILRRHGFELNVGFDAVIWGNIPGGGMSRSASLSLNLIETFLEVNRIQGIHGMQKVKLAQAVENDYIGSPCGILDPLMIYYARDEQATLFDPATNQIEHIPYGGDTKDFRIVYLDTGTERFGLEKSTYTKRRAECNLMAQNFKKVFGWDSLAAIKTTTEFNQAIEWLRQNELPGANRLQYLFEARNRFHHTISAWREGNFAQIGANFRADGLGLRDLYEISGKELETMCDLARTVEGVYGERMLGGGDKGAAGAIIHNQALPKLKAVIDRAYPLCHPNYSDKYAIHECKVVKGLQCHPLFLDKANT